jgi:hypothetical protein
LIPKSEEDLQKAAKRKKIMYFALGVLGAIGIVLAIVLPLALRKHDDPIRPDPIGPNPLPAGIMNPYYTVMQRSSSNGHMISGQLLLMNLSKSILHEDASNLVPRELFL